MSAPTLHTDLEAMARTVLDMPTPDHGAVRRRAYWSVDAALDCWCRLRVAQRSCWQREADGVPLEEIEQRRARLECMAERAWLRFQRRLQAQEGE